MADIMQLVDGLSKTRGWRKWELPPAARPSIERQETFPVLVSLWEAASQHLCLAHGRVWDSTARVIAQASSLSRFLFGGTCFPGDRDYSCT